MPIKREFQTVRIRVGDGGRLMADRPSDAVGLANYLTKENWRRMGYGLTAEEVTREGWDYFFPNTGGSAVNQKTVSADAGADVIAIGEARRPNGKCVPVAVTTLTGDTLCKIKWFDYDSAVWTTIGSGYLIPPSTRRWQIVNVGSYVVFNNGVDLPCTWKVGDASVTPIYELREQGVASVGSIWEYNQVLMCGDILEILDANMSGIMNGGSPYGAVTNPAQTQRIQFRINWSNLGDPRDFGATVNGNATSGSPTLTLTWPMASFVIGDEITVIGAGPSGGNLVTTISNVVGVTVTMAANASTTISGTPVQKTEALNSIVGFYDLEDDGAPVLRGLALQNRLVIYKSNSIFVGYYTGDVDEPFSFQKMYQGKRTPRFRWTLVSVSNRYHLYAGDDTFYKFTLGVQEPEIDRVLDDCKQIYFYNSIQGVDEGVVYAADNSPTSEVWFWPGGDPSIQVLAYDYAYECVSTVTDTYQFKCAATIHKPAASSTCDERELYFVLGDSSGIATTYGRSNIKPLTYLRYTVAFTCQWTTGIGDFGDPFNEKDVRTWIVLNSRVSPSATINFVLKGTDRNNLQTTTLEVATIETTGAQGIPTAVALFYRRIYFSESVSANTSSSMMSGTPNPLRISGRMWEVGIVNSKSITRRFSS